MPAAIVRGAGYGEVLVAAAAFLLGVLGVRDIRCRFSELALDIDGHGWCLCRPPRLRFRGCWASEKWVAGAFVDVRTSKLRGGGRGQGAGL